MEGLLKKANHYVHLPYIINESQDWISDCVALLLRYNATCLFRTLSLH